MILAIITLALLSITILSYIVGTIWLARYAFRLSALKGVLALVFPPYTFYFAFYELQHDGKDRATALWMFGIIATCLLAFIFQQPLLAALSGDRGALSAPEEETPEQKSVDLDPTDSPAANTPQAPEVTAPPEEQLVPTETSTATP